MKLFSLEIFQQVLVNFTTTAVLLLGFKDFNSSYLDSLGRVTWLAATANLMLGSTLLINSWFGFSCETYHQTPLIFQ